MIDITKYGTPIEEEKFYGKADVSKYGTPATPAPTKIGEKGKTGLKGFAVGVAKGGLEGIKGLGQLGTYLGNKVGLGFPKEYGSGNKFTRKLLSDENLKAKSSAEKLGKVAEFAGEVLIPGLGAKKGIKTAKTLDYLKNTSETITKLEEEAANLAGRVKKSFGKKVIKASKTEERAAQILRGKVSSNVTKNPQVIKKEISTRGAEVEKYLEKNKLPVTAQEQADMFSKARIKFADNATKTELKAYDEQMRVFLKRLPGKGGYTTDNFYKALKEFEEKVTSRLPKGKTALIGDAEGKGSARIVAAQDIRKVVRDMLGQKHPEFKGKMFDLASLYDVLHTALTKSRLFDVSKTRQFIGKAAKAGVLIGGGAVVGRTLLGGGGRKSFSDINSIGNQ